MEKTASIVSTVVSYLFIVLFVYAASNKILDFENFQIQLAQSPLISVYAGWVSYAVPAIEIIISALVAAERTRPFALYCCLGLMVMFTAYITIMINFSPFVPCSCGGILEKMSWEQHLAFNIVFVFLGLLGIMAMPFKARSFRKRLVRVTTITVAGTGVMAILFLTSEDMMHHRNNFTRRFPHHPVNLVETADLKYNSYYIAGADSGKVFLGNITAPLAVTEIDSNLSKKTRHTIKLIPEQKYFHMPRLTVRGHYFYISDGRSPVIYRGHTSNWTASLWTANTAYFNAFEPIDAKRAAFRAISSRNREHVLGIFYVDQGTKVKLGHILDKQTDGIFDTGGTLLYNAPTNKLIYAYTYKNQYLITDTMLKSKTVRHTIDTTSHVRVRTRYIPSTKERKLASPAWMVNIAARTSRQFLFINSSLMSRFEPEEMWEKASIIDTYDITDGSYAFSFYLYHLRGIKMSDFIITANRAYALCGQYIASYKLREDFYEGQKYQGRRIQAP